MNAEYNIKVQMFSKAHDVSIRNSEINNVGGDLTINNYNVCLPEQVRVPIVEQRDPHLSQLTWNASYQPGIT